MASSTATSPRVAYIIAELEDADPVFAPIKTASRVKVNWNSNAVFHICVCINLHLILFNVKLKLKAFEIFFLTISMLIVFNFP